MAIYKNKSGQKVSIFAWDKLNDLPKTGDQANITAQISKDGGLSAVSNDVNPTELDAANHPGIYHFDLTQAESNGDLLNITPVSSTPDIIIEPLQIYTQPEIRQSNTIQIEGTDATNQIGSEVLDKCQDVIKKYFGIAIATAGSGSGGTTVIISNISNDQGYSYNYNDVYKGGQIRGLSMNNSSQCRTILSCSYDGDWTFTIDSPFPQSIGSGDMFSLVPASAPVDMALESSIDSVKAWLECDEYINTSATPWQLVVHEKGNLSNVYFRKALKQANGSNVTSTSHIIGMKVHLV